MSQQDQQYRLAAIISTVAILVAVGIACVSVAFAGDGSPTRVTVSPQHRVVVAGCHSEDSCRADYNGKSRAWVIRRQVP
jgi:hypothetical protein